MLTYLPPPKHKVCIMQNALSIAPYKNFCTNQLSCLTNLIAVSFFSVYNQFNMCVHKLTSFAKLDIDDFVDNCDYKPSGKRVSTSRGDMKILQHNIRGLNSKLSDLQQIMKTTLNPDVILLSETWLKKHSPTPHLPGYKLERTDRKNKNSPVKGWGGLSKMSKNVKMSIHPTAHRWEWLHKSKIVKDNWIISIRLSFIWLLVIWHSSSPQPTHQTIHPPMSGGVSTEFKSSSRIELSWLIQDLLNCY